MTIQLLREWNGNRVGIYTWDSGEESRLIGLGLARAWVPGIDGEARLTDSEVTKYTAAQLYAMAAAGTLTPHETYIASDAEPPYQLWARDASTLVSPFDNVNTNSAAAYPYPVIDDAPVVVTPTVAAAAGTTQAAYEVLTTSAEVGGPTDGSNTWGEHQNFLARCADGTLFAVVFSTTAVAIQRSPTGGAYASGAWTTVATITNASRNDGDLDVHLMHNPAFDVVHLIYSNIAAGGRLDEYRIRTWNSAGTQINDTAIPNTWPGSDTPANDGWFFGGTTTGTLYSAAGIGEDGTIVHTNHAPEWIFHGVQVTQMDSRFTMQSMRWTGGGWKFSAIVRQRKGPRIVYNRLFVSPPGAEGYVVGVGYVGCKWQDMCRAQNPYYPGVGNGWTYTDSPSGLFYWGAQTILWKTPLSDLSKWTHTELNGVNWPTSDISGESGTDSRGSLPQDVIVDSVGRLWALIDNYNSGALSRECVVWDLATNTQVARTVLGTVGHYRMHEDRYGKIWFVFHNIGPANKMSILTSTLSGSTLTVQDQSGAANMKGVFGASETAWGYDMTLATKQYEAYYGKMVFRPARWNGGSVQSNNFVDFLYIVIGNYTGTAPGDTYPSAVSGSAKVKRIRVSLPVAP
jgi:hypothetical protein